MCVRVAEVTHPLWGNYKSDIRWTPRMLLQKWIRWSDLALAAPSSRAKTWAGDVVIAAVQVELGYVTHLLKRQTSRVCEFLRI